MITILSLDANARSVTFSANGVEKTITGLGEFPSQKAFVEYLESVARTEMLPQELAPLPNVADIIGSPVASADLPAEEQE